MKGLKTLDKLIFFFNILFALALLLAYALPFIPPKTFPVLSVLSLGIGPLLIINMLFFLYWLFKVKRQLFLSLVVLLLGFTNLSSFYKFSVSKSVEDPENIKILSYNIKSFNRYRWIDQDGIADSIVQFIQTKQPELLAFQEYFSEYESVINEYPFHFIQTKGDKGRFGQAIFSQFPIINQGTLEFQSQGNNALYADVVIKTDTIRLYNAHFESLRITPKVEELQKEGGERLIGRMGNTFKKQQEQMEVLLNSLESSPYRAIICTDMNNSAFSYMYHELTNSRLKDAFKQAGNGFGKSFDLNFFPLRIDFILVDESITVNGFNSYSTKFSDHFPIEATLKL